MADQEPSSNRTATRPRRIARPVPKAVHAQPLDIEPAAEEKEKRCDKEKAERKELPRQATALNGGGPAKEKSDVQQHDGEPDRPGDENDERDHRATALDQNRIRWTR